MLKATEELYGYAILAEDGLVGRVHDFLFEDDTWIVRYMVVDTGSWLPGRLVLISPDAFAGNAADWASQTMAVTLTRQQVKDSPDISADMPVSREQEAALRRYYNWPPYWAGGMYIGGMAAYYPQQVVRPEERQRPRREATVAEKEAESKNQLRSTKEVSGYKIGAIDGQIGHVDHFILDDEDWAIRYLVVATSDLLPSKHVLISPDWVESVSWARKRVVLDLTRAEVESAPEYDSHDPVNRVYEERLYDYFGRPAYWH